MISGKRVLLVGDSGGAIGGSEGPLRRADVEVVLARGGEEAIKRHRERAVDLIVADLDLPDMSAERLCEVVRSDSTLRNVSLLVLCGADEADRRRAVDCRANAHIVRPVDGEALAAQVTRLLDIPLRASFRVLARLTVGGRDRSRSFFCTSENVSLAGILVESEEQLSVGQPLQCAFFLPGGLKVSVEGRVVRETEAGMVRQYGIEFEALSAEASSALEAFVGKWRALLERGARK